MGRVAGVFDNPPGFPCTPPGVDILKGGKLTSNNVAGSSHDPLQSPAVASGMNSIWIEYGYRVLYGYELYMDRKLQYRMPFGEYTVNIHRLLQCSVDEQVFDQRAVTGSTEELLACVQGAAGDGGR